ncbi:MAG TPA: DNA repair protein RadC [Firmicutes bacterium]|nr:DNA repair protein RadC [Bacillota bacterium]
MKEKGEQLHTGHRSRMRERLLTAGPETMATHELVEMLLYYTNPRKNTNEQAHRLLQEYGSLSLLMEADPADLMHRAKVNEQTAVFFPLVRELLRRYDGERWKPRKVIGSSDEAGAYAVFLLSHEKQECFYLIGLDVQNRLIGSVLIAKGTINEAHVYTRTLVEAALKLNAKSILLAHNHPGGSLVPTQSDVETTVQIIKIMNMMDIFVADHIIVAGGEYLSMADKGLVRNLEEMN